ncbi:MAG: TlpA family protein disulfide reductase [Alphaproteobacteria bacterium]
MALATSNAAGEEIPPAFHGQLGQYTVIMPPRPVPLVPIRGPGGKEIDLSAYKGKVVVLNFWATWCAPCIREMPSLDQLHARLAGKSFAVVAVSVDRQGFAKIKPFLKRIRIARLHVYLDKGSKLYRKFGIQALPTTFVIDHEGQVRGYLEGPAEWDSKAARAVIQHYIDRVPGKKLEQKKAARE